MEKNEFQLLKPLKVIPLGPERKTSLEELPSGAKVRVLRDSRDCIDITYEDKRYFTLRNELLRSSEDREGVRDQAAQCL